MNERFGGRGTSLRSPFVPVVRLYWGRQFAQTRWGKPHHLSQITDLFGSLGFSLDAEITRLWRKRA